MKVSAVIPTYNRSDVVTRAINSVDQQNYDEAEIVVVDDGSTDDTSEIIPNLSTDKIFKIYKIGYQSRGI